ncbi:MAG: glycosyltransferase, partial [Actinomycetota bacterium]|nr:glycosyltransferase [Actinomycetota bacterium]
PDTTTDGPTFGSLMYEVIVHPRAAQSLRTIAGPDAGRRYEQRLADARRILQGRSVWHVNSTSEGGGVAELLRSCLGYLLDDGIDTRWVVIEGDPEFFRITKRIHNRLHGVLGDGGPLGDEQRRHYDDVTRSNAIDIRRSVRAGDLVVVHDPQPLGLVPILRSLGATVIWTCHIGADTPSALVRSAWDFLLPDARAAQAVTFSRAAYAWNGLEPERVRVLPPCIDHASPKNVAIDPDRTAAILVAAGLVSNPGHGGDATFSRSDGTQARVSHTAQMTPDTPLPLDVPVVLQVSRWDALKDPLGVIRGFVDEPGITQAHLMLAGPMPGAVADDPEAATVREEVHELWESLSAAHRERVHLANLPAEDVDENATIVNALQRHADVVVQKSLAEGFGLTVTEAMWKGRALVAAGVGGIRDQIEDGVSGILVDPRDLTAFGNAIEALLGDPSLAAGLGEAAQRRVRYRYLAPHYLGAYLQLFAELA